MQREIKVGDEHQCADREDQEVRDKQPHQAVSEGRAVLMGQHDRETVREYKARLGGRLTWCGLVVACSRAGCDHKVSYANDLIFNQLLLGLKTR